nr:hypothetical protein [Achromobacter insuavis]
MNFSLAVQISFFRRAVFQTNDDGLFLYESMANELALTPGAFNFPYGPYKDMPPPGPVGKWPQRLGNAWALVDDYRTTPLWWWKRACRIRLAASIQGRMVRSATRGRGRFFPCAAQLVLLPPAQRAARQLLGQLAAMWMEVAQEHAGIDIAVYLGLLMNFKHRGNL